MGGGMDAGMDGWMGGGMEGWMVERVEGWTDSRRKEASFLILRLGFRDNFNKYKSEHTFSINSKWMHAEYIPDDAFTLAIRHIYESIVWD